MNGAIAEASEFTEVIPDNNLGNQLRVVAKLIEARKALGMRRQIYFCAMGWLRHAR